MNFTVEKIRINSKWFDDLGRKKNVYQKIGYKGLNLYFQLYKFRLHEQENEHTFVTSISLLRKETGYKTEEVFELLKKMKSAKIINIENVSRWDYLIENRIDKVIHGDGSIEYVEKEVIKDKDTLVITATDTFPIFRYVELEEGEFFIPVPLNLLQLYKDKGLNEKYYALYCLIQKYSSGVQDKMWMSISKMSEFLETEDCKFDKDFINQMIYNLNRHYLLSSYRLNNNKGGWKYEHYILDDLSEDRVNSFIEGHKTNMDRLIKRVDKRKKNKKPVNIEEELESLEVEEVPVTNNIKSSFGEPKENWGKFKDNVDEITPEEIDSLCDELYELL